MLSGDPGWVLTLPESDVLTYYVAYGEAYGGEWDYTKMQWRQQPKPKAVLAIPAELKK